MAADSRKTKCLAVNVHPELISVYFYNSLPSIEILIDKLTGNEYNFYRKNEQHQSLLSWFQSLLPGPTLISLHSLYKLFRDRKKGLSFIKI